MQNEFLGWLPHFFRMASVNWDTLPVVQRRGVGIASASGSREEAEKQMGDPLKKDHAKYSYAEQGVM